MLAQLQAGIGWNRLALTSARTINRESRYTLVSLGERKSGACVPPHVARSRAFFVSLSRRRHDRMRQINASRTWTGYNVVTARITAKTIQLSTNSDLFMRS